jgi:hypothetical protein
MYPLHVHAMARRHLRAPAIAAALVACVAPAAAQYDYGRRGAAGGAGEEGFLVHLEGVLANPRNVDNVVATDIAAATLTPVIPSWDDEVAGRIGIGWGFANGNRVTAAYWRFETDQSASGSGTFALAIGPPIPLGTSFSGTVGGYFDATTELSAETVDVAWGRTLGLGDRFDLDWSLGLRHASFEEIHVAAYDEALTPVGTDSFAAAKSNEGEMIGARLGLLGRYRLAGPFSIAGGFAFSRLDGELKSRSSLTPTGTGNAGDPAASASVTDDGRSGGITDLEVALAWHARADRLRLSLGWEQSTWDEITADLMRNFPGTLAPLRERDSITFSGYKLGLRLRF